VYCDPRQGLTGSWWLRTGTLARIFCATHNFGPDISDSQSILKALDNPKIVSRQVWECAQGLNELSKVNFVNLIWVPGHYGILGNEKADYLASTAGSEPFIGPEPILPISYSMIESSIGNWAHKQSDVYW